MKQKIILRIAIFFAILIAVFAIENFKNEVYADVPEGSLKITINVDNGLENGSFGITYFNAIQYHISRTDNEDLDLDTDFSTRNDFHCSKLGTKIIQVVVENNKWQKGKNPGEYYIELTGMPNYSYKIKNMSASLSSSSSYYNIYKTTYTPNEAFVTINNNQGEVNGDLLVTKADDFYLYYKDYVGDNPSVVLEYKYGLNPIKFNYSKDDDGNNIYTFSKDGTTSEVEVKSEERTILKDMPASESGSYRIKYKNSYGSKLFAYGITIPSGAEYAENEITTGWNSISRLDAYFENVNLKKVAKINKITNQGKVANAKFKLFDKEKNQFCKFDYYESYEFEGTTYSNVYVINGEWSDEGEEIEEIETKDSEAIILYPLAYYKYESDYHSGNYRPTHYEIYESSSDESLLYQTTEKLEEFTGENYVKSWDSGGIQQYLSKYNGGNIETALENNPGEFDYANITDQFQYYTSGTSYLNIRNYIKPSVRKIVLNPDGTENTTCEDEFEFGLYTNNCELVNTVKLKANEKKYFNVQWYDSTKPNYFDPTNNATYFIAEKKKSDYTCESAIGTEIPGTNFPGASLEFPEELLAQFKSDVYENGFVMVASASNYVEVTFTNKMIPTEVTGEKKWDDNNNEAGKRPEIITILLKEKEEIVKRIEVEADEEGKWNYKFENIPKYKNGEEIEYTVDEEAVDMYEAIIEGFDITNIFKCKNVTVTKEWDDSENKDGIRPSQLSIQLYGNNEPIGEPITLSDENDWTYTWKYLRIKLNNNEIEYIVKEVDIPDGYTVEVSGNEEDGFVIKNVHVIEPEEEEPKEEEPKEEEPKEEEPKEEPQKEEKPSPIEQVQTGDKILLCVIVLIGTTMLFFISFKAKNKNK